MQDHEWNEVTPGTILKTTNARNFFEVLEVIPHEDKGINILSLKNTFGWKVNA